MTKYISSINFDDAEIVIKKLQNILDQSAPVLIVEPSIIKSRITIKSLNEAGYFNILVLDDNNKLEAKLKEAKPYFLIFMDGDIGENESFRTYLTLKQKNKNIPKTIFFKEQPNEKWNEFYQKGGSLGCIGRQFNINCLNELLNLNKSELEEKSTIAFAQFNDGCIVKLIGNIVPDLIMELVEKLDALMQSKTTRCILDFSRVKGFDLSIERIIKASAAKFLKNSRVIEIFDPKNKLGKFNLEQIEGIVIV